jgi:hypothetical protein
MGSLAGLMQISLAGWIRAVRGTALPLSLFVMAGAAAGGGVHGEPFADVHVHYNWDQKEVITAARVARKLEQHNVEFAVVAGTPSDLALELKQAAGDRVVALFSPYTHALGRRDWYRNGEVLRQAEEGLRDGRYEGIGEVHFMAGFRPRTDNPVFLGLLDLARKYHVPMLVHVDAGSDRVFRGLCEQYSDIRFIFAHAGGNLAPRHIRSILEACDSVLVEFSARDPWRYGGLTGDDGLLLPGWKELVLDYPRRFVTGTDPVWRVTRGQSWDQADDGWEYFEQLLAFHRRWLGGLPPRVESLLRVENARRFFGRRPRVKPAEQAPGHVAGNTGWRRK